METEKLKSKLALLKFLFDDATVCHGENCHALNAMGHSAECIKEPERCYSQANKERDK